MAPWNKPPPIFDSSFLFMRGKALIMEMGGLLLFFSSAEPHMVAVLELARGSLSWPVDCFPICFSYDASLLSGLF